MRYPAAEKLEIIRLVEQSHLPVRRTLGQLGIPPATFYRWYERFQAGGLSVILCARQCLSSEDEALAEDHGELRLCLGPLPRRAFPFAGRMIEHEV